MRAPVRVCVIHTIRRVSYIAESRGGGSFFSSSSSSFFGGVAVQHFLRARVGLMLVHAL